MALQRGDLAQAKSALEEVAREQPTNAYAWVSLAEIYARLKRPVAAATAAGKAERFGADDPAISHALAMYFAGTKDFGQAAQLEQKFAESATADPNANERVASLFLNAGKVQEALAAAERAAKLHPSPAAEDIFGRALIAAGRADEGEKHLSTAWEGLNTNSQFAFDYSQALLLRQDFGKAAEVLSTALERHSDDTQLLLALGVARYGQRRFGDAMAAFLRVIQLDPKVEQPYSFLGKMLDQAGEHLPEITGAYERWLVRNPQSPQAMLLLAKARCAIDPKDPTAENLLRRSISIDGHNWEAHYELGVLLEGKRDWAGAATELKRSSQLDEKQAMPHYHLARVYDRLGDTEKAKAEREVHQTLTGNGK